MSSGNGRLPKGCQARFLWRWEEFFNATWKES